MQVLGAGGGLGGPAHTDVNFGGKTSNLGAAPHDWGFAKKVKKNVGGPCCLNNANNSVLLAFKYAGVPLTCLKQHGLYLTVIFHA